MKTIQKEILLSIIVCFLLTTSACQTTSNQALDKKSDEVSGLSEQTPSYNSPSHSYQEDVTRQTKKRDITYSPEILKKRDIRRSSDRIVVKEQIKDEDVARPTISDKKQRKLLHAADQAIKDHMYRYAIKKIDAILKKKPDDETALALRTKVQLLLNAERATKEERYEDAIKIAKKILKDSPDDEAALAFIENAQVIQEDIRHNKIMAQIKKVDVYERNRYFENLREKSIPYNELMQFTTEDEWKDIKERAQREDVDKRLEENREYTERLQIAPSPPQKPISQDMKMKLGEKLSIEFINTPLRDVIAFLQEKAHINIILYKDIAEANINIKLNNVPISMIFDYILPKGSGYLVKDNVVYITKDPLELRVYDVRDLLINMEDRRPSITAQVETTGAEDRSTAFGEDKDSFDRVQEIITLITNTIEPQSWKSYTDGSGGRGLIAAREGMLGDIVITHVVGIHKQVEDLLAALRSSADLQISIEARFIAVSDNFLEAFGNNINQFDTTQASASKRRGIFTEAGDTFIDTGATTGLGTVVPGTTSAGINLTYQIFDGLFLKGFLKAVQESDEAETVTAPKITLSNTQRGTIKVVKTFSYVEKFEIVSQTPEPVIKEIDDGTTFNVRPIVSADRKYVYLEVHPVITSVDLTGPGTSVVYETTVAGAGGTGAAGTASNTIQLPITTKQELSVTVCVPDKGILLIGGLGKSTETKTSKGVPILSKIPIIKRLFSSNTTRRDITLNDNLIILIKPTILIREEQETSAFARKREVEIRFPSGVR